MVSDGPFAETREQISGFFIVVCENLDEAIDVAANVPGAWYGTVEVRPVAGAQPDWLQPLSSSGPTSSVSTSVSGRVAERLPLARCQ